MDSIDEFYDVAILGAGMSALAAGIRLAHFGKKVVILERHNAPGGLNSFYSLNGRKFDVGLHALTNFVPSSIKNTPLPKIIRQLRLDRDALLLSPQSESHIRLGSSLLKFSNDFSLLQSEISQKFPNSIDGFQRLSQDIAAIPLSSFGSPFKSTRQILPSYIPDPELRELLLLPLTYYGSYTPNDIDWEQFVILFQAMYLEGLSRPAEGVRALIRQLLDRFRSSGGRRLMKTEVTYIHTHNNAISSLQLSSGKHIRAQNYISSIGYPETLQLISPRPTTTSHPGDLSFVEAILILNAPPSSFNWHSTITFFSEGPSFTYQKPSSLLDLRSGVICFPTNYQYAPNSPLPENQIRITFLANYDAWSALSPQEYSHAKTSLLPSMIDAVLKFLPPSDHQKFKSSIQFTDMFTPKTIHKFTSRLSGAVYGSPEKLKSGLTPYQNLFICGTDQGLVGIIGALISGITIANNHILTKS